MEHNYSYTERQEPIVSLNKEQADQIEQQVQSVLFTGSREQIYGTLRDIRKNFFDDSYMNLFQDSHYEAGVKASGKWSLPDIRIDDKTMMRVFCASGTMNSTDSTMVGIIKRQEVSEGNPPTAKTKYSGQLYTGSFPSNEEHHQAVKSFPAKFEIVEDASSKERKQSLDEQLWAALTQEDQRRLKEIAQVKDSRDETISGLTHDLLYTLLLTKKMMPKGRTIPATENLVIYFPQLQGQYPPAGLHEPHSPLVRKPTNNP